MPFRANRPHRCRRDTVRRARRRITWWARRSRAPRSPGQPRLPSTTATSSATRMRRRTIDASSRVSSSAACWNDSSNPSVRTLNADFNEGDVPCLNRHSSRRNGASLR